MNHTEFTTGAGTRRAPVPDITSFDGHLLSDHNVVVERVYDSLPDMREEMADRVGAHGAYARGLYLGPREITLECRAFCDGWSDFEDIRTELSGFLYSPEERRLVLRNHPGQFYMAHYRSMEEGDRDNESCGLTIKFVASDPLRYEDSTRSLVAAGDSPKEFEVGGTGEAKLTMEMRNCSGTASVRMLGSSSGTTQTTSIAGGRTVKFDCVNHVVTCDDIVSGVTLGSRWPVLTPGRWWVTPYGGTLTMTWRESYR